MFVLLIWIHIFSAIIQLCASFPISVTAVGERNAFMFGTITFFTFGVVLFGCIFACCRRRKKGFKLNNKTDQKEFQNELGASESNKTEYPIFQALSSLENQRNNQISNANIVAAENLITDDQDNNNGPISSTDLENIENNNAINYIHNQNEIDNGIIEAAIEAVPIQYCRNDEDFIEESPLRQISNMNNINTSIDIESIKINLLEASTMATPAASATTSTAKLLIKNENDYRTLNASDHNLIRNITIINNNNNNNNNENSNRLVSSVEIHTFDTNFYKGTTTFDETTKNNTAIKNIEIERNNFENYVPTNEANNTSINSTVVLLRNEFDTSVHDKSQNELNFLLFHDNEQQFCCGEDEESIRSDYSIKSNEENSVEEALRALDDVIKGEELDINDEDNNETLYKEELNEDSVHFQYVIQQLLKNNKFGNDDDYDYDSPIQNHDNFYINEKIETMKNQKYVSNLTNKDIEKNDISYETIHNTAELLIDSILKESKLIAEMRRDAIKINYDNDNKSYSSVFVENNLQSFSKDTEKEIDIEEDLINVLSRSNSLEDVFSKNIKTSTPCVQNKNKYHGEDIQFNNRKVHRKCLNETFDNITLKNNEFENNVENDTFAILNDNSDNDICINNETKILITSPVENRTFELNDRTFIHPGDPCTSKQALERDYDLTYYHHGRRNHEENNSDDLTTLTPMNTPIELNYPCDTWNQIIQKTSSTIIEDEKLNYQGNETFDVEEQNEADLESTFEALKRQLAEILPQPQAINNLADYSDEEENESNRTFDEYRSPLDGIIGLLENENSSSTAAQNEVFINYKRSLSPIIEESEEETCKTFVMNETKCLDSTSGCVETGEAIMGVTKTLMASNDTLFNFEDTLGEKEDVFSPRIPSRNDIQNQQQTSVRSDNSAATISNESTDTDKDDNNVHHDSNSERNDQQFVTVEKKTPPKTIEFAELFELKQENELCSPDQQKTFSDGTTSSTTDRLSSDISPTIGHDTTFTTNTNDEKTCITVIIKDDERISEISEPDWGSTASFGGCDQLNSLTDVPSLDFNVNDFEHDEQNYHFKPLAEYDGHNEKLSSEENISSLNNIERDIGHDDSGHSTQASTADDKSIGGNSLQNNPQDETMKNQEDDQNYEETTFSKEFNNAMITSEGMNLINTRKCEEFLNNKDNYYSFDLKVQNDIIHDHSNNVLITNFDINVPKQNTDLNLKKNLILCMNENNILSDKQDINKLNNENVVMRLTEKFDNPLISECLRKEMDAPITYKEIYQVNELKVNDQPIISNFDKTNNLHVQDVKHEIINILSGEEDPWAEEQMKSYPDVLNEWDSDVDDSHSSEEFMYIRGIPSSKEEEENTIKNNSITNSKKDIIETEEHEDENDEYEDENDDKICDKSNLRLLTKDEKHNKPKKIKHSTEEELSEDESLSEFEGEFIPSCWDSMAVPARSALKSPNKSSSNETKKHRNVAFKKQRYHSVYEYPKENTSLPSSYSESSLWNKNSQSSSYFNMDCKEECNDGFMVSSSMRPFRGYQFNTLCHTWPTDSDFSWSQIIESLDNKPLETYSNMEIKINDHNFSNETSNNASEAKRPDSGVGESAEMLSDRISIGELCHTKSTLNLPLNMLSSSSSSSSTTASVTGANNTTVLLNTVTGEIIQTTNISNNKDESEYFKMNSIMLPTPSCTGSMDSLSSSSGSEHQIINLISSSSSSSLNNKSNAIKQNITITEYKQQESNISNNLHCIHNNVDDDDVDECNLESIMVTNGDNDDDDDRNLSNTNFKIDKIRQNDSTDEDSGIESIMKVNK